MQPKFPGGDLAFKSSRIHLESHLWDVGDKHVRSIEATPLILRLGPRYHSTPSEVQVMLLPGVTRGRYTILGRWILCYGCYTPEGTTGEIDTF